MLSRLSFLNGAIFQLVLYYFNVYLCPHMLFFGIC